MRNPGRQQRASDPAGVSFSPRFTR